MRLTALSHRRRRTRATATDTIAGPVSDEELLATPLDDQDIDERLAAAGTRTRPRSTKILISVALVVFGFAVGAATGRTAAEISAAVAEQQADVDGPVPGVELDPSLHGTVRVVDGTAMYVQLADQTVVRVQLTPTTTVSSVVDARAQDLTPGTPVRIFGQVDEPGVFHATEIIGLHGP